MRSAPASTLLAAIRRELAARGDARRAIGARAYMKSAMPFHGVALPEVRRLCRGVFARSPLVDLPSWQSAVLTLWRRARFREERYAAIELTGVPVARAWQTLTVLPMYEEMIVTGAWWDYVDWIATHRIGGLLRNTPAPMARVLRGWAKSDDLWKRRSAILAQVRFGQSTDLGLLYACIEPSLESREFFLRKAIGWALRQHARVDPDEIRGYVERHRPRLSSLSIREALRHL